MDENNTTQDESKVSIDDIKREPMVHVVDEPVRKKSKKMKTALMVIIGVVALLLISGGAFAYLYYTGFFKKAETADTNQPKHSDLLNMSEIAWNEPKLTTSLQIFAGDNGYGFNREAQAKYYEVGKYQKGPNKDAKIILATATYDGPAVYPGYYRFIQKQDKLTLLTKYSDKLYDEDKSILTNKFTQDTTTVISDLEYPDTISGSEKRQILNADKTVNEFFSLNNLKSSFKNEKYGQIYTTDNPGNQSGINDRNGFYLKASDGTVRVYYLKADFIDDSGVANITWSNGSKNTDKYAVGDVAGCGRRNYATVVSAYDSKKKQISGKSSAGDTLYDNQTDYENEDFYNNKYQGEWNDTQKKMVKVTYQQFLAAHPLVFWTDPFGRVIQLENTKYIFQGGCGKPVIYLYPKETTKVSVKLVPQGGFTKTEPAYNNGWNVFADSLGNLTEILTGKKYPYLFWEGFGNIYQDPNKGFVIKQSEVHTFLNTKLAKLGLNTKETADFEEFWEPRMKSAPYYFVSFWGNREMDAIAPLTIDPKPDTVIRVLMDYKPLDAPIKVQGYDIQTPARNGFTVVEWGGVLR